VWLRVTSPRWLLCLNISQISFHFAVICATLYFLCLGEDVHSVADMSTLPAAFALLLLCVCMLLLRSFVASGLIMLRMRDPQLWRRSAPAWYRRLQLLMLAVSAVAATVAFVALISIPVPPTTSLFIPWLLLWGCTAAEMFSSLLTVYMYAHLHLVFPHSALSLVQPHVPVDELEEEQQMIFKSEGQPTREQLDAIPCQTYRETMRCDRLCAICILDMQPGDNIRLFSCGHGQSLQNSSSSSSSALSPHCLTVS
jgi:hypothetical protein